MSVIVDRTPNLKNPPIHMYYMFALAVVSVVVEVSSSAMSEPVSAWQDVQIAIALVSGRMEPAMSLRIWSVLASGFANIGEE